MPSILTTTEFGWFGGARFRTLFQGPDYDLQESRQPPGLATPLHRHTRYDERLWVVDGGCEAWVEDRHVTLVAGDTLSIPRGSAHAIRSGPDGSHGLVSSRPGLFAALMERVTTPEDVLPDLEQFARAAAEFGDELLGPPGALPGPG